jgi:phage terminase large subunit
LAADEAQDIRPGVLTQIIMPALADRQGWLDLSGTPKGWGNLLGATYKRGLDDPEWFVQVLKASKTGIIAEVELARLRKSMPENEYLQEFECSFDAAITGAYFAKEIKKLEEAGSVTSVPHDPMLKTHTAWDLGIADSMCIWFWQQVGREVRIIDYYEASGYGLDHYAKVLSQKPYLYGKHFGPHDIRVRELGTGKSRYEIARGLGIEFTVVRMLPVKDGIDAVRMLLPRCWIDAKRCAIGLDALRQYREKVDEKRNISLGPLHDWSSHAADAARMMAIGIQEDEKPDELEDEDHMPQGAHAWMG